MLEDKSPLANVLVSSTNGQAMEKELYIESVGDAGSSGASKSYICVLKPPATYEWLTPTDPMQHQRNQTDTCL